MAEADSSCKTCFKGLKCPEHDYERQLARNISKKPENAIDENDAYA